jgi:uncharacterized protein YegP (UPF0339 family)
MDTWKLENKLETHFQSTFNPTHWFARGLVMLLASLALASCGGGKSNGSPAAQGNAILPSAAKLTPPALTFPPTDSHPSNASTLNITGTCTTGPGAKVFLGGDEDQQTPCTAGGQFSFSVTKTNDGTFNYSLREESLIHHPSDNTDLTWMRSTSIPLSPTILAPASHPYLSSTDTLTISGGCSLNHTLSLSGDATNSTSCSDLGAYSFAINKSVDGTYVFNITQSDIFGNQSEPVQTSWTRDTAVPTAPTIIAPIVTPYTSSDSSLSLSGACANNTTIQLGGRTTDSVGCSNNSYSFTLSEGADGSFNYTLVAVSQTNVPSTTTSFQWIRSSSVPATPILTSPLTSPYYSNTGAIVISGSCTNGNTVYLTEGPSNTPLNNLVCASDSFSFNVAKSTDGSHSFTIYQQLGSSQSGAVGIIWNRDTLPPIAPILTTPGITPYYSAATNLLISGVCENGSSVNLTGDSSNMTNCISSSFTFNISKTTNTTYNFTITQTDAAGNSSSGATQQWVLDTSSPSAPTIATPATSPLISNGDSFTIAGACEPSATVYLTGDSNQQVNCTASAYSFTVNKTSDATFNFTLHQTDLGGSSSSTNSTQWIRDTLAPSAPSIENPVANPFTSSDTNLTISGACENGAVINYSGAASGTTNCTASAYSFNVSKGTDGTYDFSISQSDSATNTSPSSSFQWIRLSSVPATPSFSTPTSNPFYGKLSTLTLTGTCATGNSVELSGAESQTQICAGNAFTFNLTQGTNGTFSYNVAQINSASISSGLATFSWIYDSQSPSNVVITNPASSPMTNSASALIVSGSCEANATVSYSGAAIGTTACSGGGTFTFTVNKATDGIYTINMSQTDRADNSSGTATVTWTRDTLAPSPPSVTQPLSNPFTSGDTNLAIAGDCEPNAGVSVTGSTTFNGTCSAIGTYSFNVSKVTDGTYTFAITQTDLAGNVSSTMNFQWVRDTSIPFTPVISTPATSPFSSNGSSISISVTCQTGLSPQEAVVHLTGVLASEVLTPAATLDQSCTTSPVTFVIEKTTDGTFSFNFNQENPNNSAVSADISLTWLRDTQAPLTPTITSPSASPYIGPGNLTLAGACESNSTVFITGDATQSQTCVTNNYSFSIIKSTDATYNFSVNQTDLAGNTSTSASQQWTRNSSSLPPPTITSPALNPYQSNSSTLTISGSCEPDYTVTIGGNLTGGEVTNPSGALTQTCTSGGNYSFTINKSTDGTYLFSLTESFNNATSAATNFTWTLDTLAPTTTIATVAPNPNLITSITFTFSAPETAIFQCKLGAATYQSCTSPITYTGLANGASNFSVVATDSVSNIGAVATHNWTQAAYNSVAVYHLAAGTGAALNDSGLFTSTAAFSNHLTSNGSPTTNTSGKLPSASPTSFTLGANSYFSVANNGSINSTANQMTVEGLYNFSTLASTTGQYYTLMSATGPSSPDLGWELRLEKQNSGGCSKWKLKFLASLNGSTQSTVTSNSCITLNTSKWYYVALTWNKGTVNFYMSNTGATSRGSGVIGTAGSSVLATPNVPLKIGANSTSGTGSSLWITGSVDEVRISNTVRTPSYPAAEFTAD